MKRMKMLFLGLTLTLTACGGGGGGTAPSNTYSGVTTQATVTSANAKALSVDAYQGGQIGAALSSIGVLETGADGQPTASRLQTLESTLEASVKRILRTSNPAAPTLAGVTEQRDLPGTYGGTLHYSITADQSTGAFSGTITFTNYRDVANGPGMSGSVTFSGVYNQTSQTFSSFNVSIGALTVAEGSKSFTVSGTVSLNQSAGSNSVTMSVLLRDNAAGRSFWVKDFTLIRSPLGTTTLTGTYYDPVHGYVTVSTVTPLQVAVAGDWPTAGQLLFTGANGTKARLTFTQTGYTVEVDASGNNSFTPVP